MSFEKILSSYQSIPTRTFFENPGSLPRYMPRQSHHAINPENLIPGRGSNFIASLSMGDSVAGMQCLRNATYTVTVGLCQPPDGVAVTMSRPKKEWIELPASTSSLRPCRAASQARSLI
jgi:hypothetical protein